MAAFSHEVQIEIAEKIRERVGVVPFEGVAGVRPEAEAVVLGVRPIAVPRVQNIDTVAGATGYSQAAGKTVEYVSTSAGAWHKLVSA